MVEGDVRTTVFEDEVVGKEAEFVAGSFILTQRALDEAPYRYSSFLTQVSRVVCRNFGHPALTSSA